MATADTANWCRSLHLLFEIDCRETARGHSSRGTSKGLVVFLSNFSHYICFQKYIFVMLSLQYFVEMNTPIWDCIYCGHPMTNKEEQRIHVQKDCKERPAWEDVCPFCGLEFPSKHSLAIHMSRWCKERPTRNG